MKTTTIKKNKVLSLKVEDSIFNRIKNLSKDKEISTGEIIRKMIDNHFNGDFKIENQTSKISDYALLNMIFNQIHNITATTNDIQILEKLDIVIQLLEERI